MRILFFLSILLLLLMSGCTVEPPDWIHGSSINYPSRDYLTAVGLDQIRALAEEKAREKLLEQLPPQSKTIESGKDGGRIAEVWHDRQGDLFYALAVIDRHKAGKPLLDALAILDGTIVGQALAAETADSSLIRWGHYLQAASLEAKRKKLADQVQRIDPAAILPAIPYSLPQLNERSRLAAAEVGVEITLRNDQDDLVKQSLIRAFAKRGLRLAPDFAAGLQIHGSVEMLSQNPGVPAVAVIIEVEGEGDDGLPLPPIEGRGDPGTIGELLTARLVDAVISLVTE